MRDAPAKSVHTLTPDNRVALRSGNQGVRALKDLSRINPNSAAIR
jgi:hypothetical protein